MAKHAVSIVARPRLTADDTGLAVIYLESRTATFNWLDAREFSLSDFERDTKGELVLVAELEGSVVGFSSSWTPENFLHHLYVAPSRTGCGVGSALLDATLRRLGRPARLKCKSLNVRAMAFYRSRGWRTIEHGETEGDPYHLLEFVGDGIARSSPTEVGKELPGVERPSV